MTTPHQLIENYVAAANAHDAQRVAAAFLADGTVRDEGELHRGRAAIGAWATEASARYNAVIEPQGVTEAAGKHILRATVRGNFPGSPALLAFSFVLGADGIASLEVTA